MYYGVVLMTTQLMQQTPENGTSCDSGIAYLPWQICSRLFFNTSSPLESDMIITMNQLRCVLHDLKGIFYGCCKSHEHKWVPDTDKCFLKPFQS